MTDGSEILDAATETENEPIGNSEQLSEPVGNTDKLEPDAGTVAENETVEEPVEEPEPLPWADDISRDEAKARIFELKNFLTATDYKAIKYAEGALTADEYEPDRQARANARAEINRLEETLNG